jgi:hypothetical protein
MTFSHIQCKPSTKLLRFQWVNKIPCKKKVLLGFWVFYLVLHGIFYEVFFFEFCCKLWDMIQFKVVVEQCLTAESLGVTQRQ